MLINISRSVWVRYRSWHFFAEQLEGVMGKINRTTPRPTDIVNHKSRVALEATTAELKSLASKIANSKVVTQFDKLSLTSISSSETLIGSYLDTSGFSLASPNLFVKTSPCSIRSALG